MSICLYMRQVSEDDVARFRRDPEALEAATIGTMFGHTPFPDDLDQAFNPDMLDDVMGKPRGLFGWIGQWLLKRWMKRSLRKQLEQLNKVKAAGAAPPGSAGAADIPSPDAMVDLHKSWHVLHYLLTGTADGGTAPLNLLMTGGEDLGDDVGYGPARVWNAATVQAFADAVRGLSVEDLMARADYARMLEAQIYSCDDADDDPEMALMELQEMVEHYFPALQAFVTKAAKERACALVWMS